MILEGVKCAWLFFLSFFLVLIQVNQAEARLLSDTKNKPVNAKKTLKLIKPQKNSLPIKLKKMSYRKDKNGQITSVVFLLEYKNGLRMEFSEKGHTAIEKDYSKMKPFLVDKSKVFVWSAFNNAGEIAVKVDIPLKKFKTIIIPIKIDSENEVSDLILRFRRKGVQALVSNRVVSTTKKIITRSLFESNKRDRLLVKVLTHSSDQSGALVSGVNEGGTVNELLSDVRFAFDADYTKTLTPFWDFKAYAGLRWHIFSDDLPVNISKDYEAFAPSLGAGAAYKQNKLVKHDFLLGYQNRMLHSLVGSEITFDLDSFIDLKYQPMFSIYRSSGLDFFIAPKLSFLLPVGSDFKNSNEYGIDLMFFFTPMKKISGFLSYSKGSFSTEERKIDLETLEFGLGYTFSL
jgi:hypothetical protein